jgi:WD40 repeat protein
MARIFISHSSRDNNAAARMKSWLESEKFETTFLDFDGDGGIPPGADWEKTLYREVEQSQAVIVVETPNWVNSKWCFAEYTQARALGKAIFRVIEAPTQDSPISPGIQKLDLTGNREGGLKRLLPELVRIALDAQGGFTWDAGRPPFPALFAFQEEDAAVYFGRDDEIRRLIERLEARRAQGGARLIALLGSSGSGKSSLLRAGVIPRLKRAGRNWIVIPPIRPGDRPVNALALAVAVASGPGTDLSKLKDSLRGSVSEPIHQALDNLATNLRVKAGAVDAQILIPIDQGEELFSVADPGEARRFLQILNEAMSENLPFLAVMTLRSDFLSQLQSAEALTTRFDQFSLGPIPPARIPEIIRGPARVAGLAVEEAFVQQAARDAETKDALPLLAFALRELLDRSPNRFLSLADYEALGDKKEGLTPIENAVRQAADVVLAAAKPADEELAALREALVPAMVRVNDQGQYVRRRVRWEELPAKSYRLLQLLADARLLVVGQDPGDDGRMVEVAHEALLRNWPLLKPLLVAASEFLIGKPQLEQDLRDWELAPATKEAKASAWLSGLKLSRARKWLIEYPAQLTRRERTFIGASIRHVGREDRQKEETRRLAVANESRALTALSQAASLQGRYTDAVKLALAAWPRSAADERPQLYRTIDALGEALSGPLEVAPPLQHDEAVLSAAFSPNGAWAVTASADKTARIWDAATGAPIGKPLRHEDWVFCASFSREGARVATASADYTARVWDAATGTPLGKPLQHDGVVVGAAFSPDGALVATASDDGTAGVWDAASGAPIGKPLQHERHVNTVAFSPNGAWLVTASEDKTAQVWDAATGAPIGAALRHEGTVNSAAFSPDGGRVVTASRDKAARAWDAATGAPIGQPMQHEDSVNAAAFSPDGALVVTASDDNTARLWDAATGAAISRPLQHQGVVNSAAFSPDGARVLTASNDKTVRVWDAATGAAIGRPLQHEGTVNSAAFSPDSSRIVTASDNNTARVWDAATGAPIGRALRHEGAVRSAAFRPDGAEVVTASDDKTARVWDAAGGLIGQPLRHEDQVRSAAFSPDGRLVVTASDDKTARVWVAMTGAPIGLPLQHEDVVFRASFSPDSARVVTSSFDKTARVWDAATGAPIGKPLQHDRRVSSSAFSPDGALVVTASEDKTARLWDAATGAPIGKPLQHEDTVWSAAFSPDGARVVTASHDDTARVWDAATGAPIGKPLQHKGTVWSAAFSPDGALVVTASDDNTARLWDATTGAPISRPLRHGGGVASAAFSPDGARVVTVSWDNTARVWDAATGAPIGQPFLHEGWADSAAFSSDGSRVVTASRDSTARVWLAPPVAPNIVAAARKMLGSNRDTADLSARYGINVKDPICTGDEPAPDPSRMIDR